MRAGALEAALSPSLGGGLLWLTHGGTDILRHTAEGETSPLGFASFPLVPYANRIANGRFSFRGGVHQMPLNFGDHPHSLHGHGWQTGWSVERQSENEALLSLRHEADARWPWSFQVDHHVALTPDTLSMALTFLNLSSEEAPVGLGFHPYFQSDDATLLQFDAGEVWLSTPDLLPERAVDADHFGDWSTGASVRGDMLIDNIYGRWTGTATITRGNGLRIGLKAEGADWLHVYRPPDLMAFCLEPVSHMPDAINSDGMEMLTPGASSTLSMTISVDGGDETLP